MQQVLSILLSQGGELGTQQNELDRIEKVTLPAAISPDDYIVLGTKRLDFTLTTK